jgi:hypothetical protein
MFEGTGFILPSFSPPMLSFLTAVFAGLPFAFCPPAGEPGDTPPNRRPSARREKASGINALGSTIVGLAVPDLELLALGAGHRQARNGHCLVRRGRPGRPVVSRGEESHILGIRVLRGEVTPNRLKDWD